MVAASPKPELAALNQRYRAALVAFFMRRIRDQALAEDLTQEVFVRMATSSHEGVDNIEGYLFQIARNLLRDSQRRKHVRTSYVSRTQMDDLHGIDTRDSERIVIARQAIEKVATVLDQLPERTRAIFILHRMETLTRREIADAYGISVSAVEKHLGKVMALLVAELGGL